MSGNCLRNCCRDTCSGLRGGSAGSNLIPSRSSMYSPLMLGCCSRKEVGRRRRRGGGSGGRRWGGATMPRGGGALGSIQGFSTRLSRFPGGERLLFRLKSGWKGGITWKEREPLLFSTFNVRIQFFMRDWLALCGAEGNIQIVCACLCYWTFSCWTMFIKYKSTPVFLTPLSSLILKGNKTIQFLPLIQNPFLIQTSKYFPNLFLLLLTFYEEKIIPDEIYVSLANLKSAFTC